jgi:hypothetical protein
MKISEKRFQEIKTDSQLCLKFYATKTNIIIWHMGKVLTLCGPGGQKVFNWPKFIIRFDLLVLLVREGRDGHREINVMKFHLQPQL